MILNLMLQKRWRLSVNQSRDRPRECDYDDGWRGCCCEMGCCCCYAGHFVNEISIRVRVLPGYFYMPEECDREYRFLVRVSQSVRQSLAEIEWTCSAYRLEVLVARMIVSRSRSARSDCKMLQLISPRSTRSFERLIIFSKILTIVQVYYVF